MKLDTPPDYASVVKTERRIDRKVRMLQIAAVLCALFAATGIAHGMHEANPNGGWLIPAFAGLVAASALAVFWHVVIGAIIGMVRLSMLIALFVGATIVTAVAVGASAQAIATAIAGHSALSAELSLLVDGYNKALSEAHKEATGWRAVADAALATATGYRGQAETETSGANGTGKGCGPRCAYLRDTAEVFTNGAAALNRLLDEADAIRDSGDLAMSQLRSAASHSDQNAFMAAAEEINQAIARLNAVDPKPVIGGFGMIKHSETSIDLSEETAEFRNLAEKALADRKQIEAPTFSPMSLGEATRRQAFGSALHGWILAGAIDVLPLFFLALVFVLSREVWLNEDVDFAQLTHKGRNERDRRRIEDLRQGRNGKVVPLQAAE